MSNKNKKYNRNKVRQIISSIIIIIIIIVMLVPVVITALG